jgi:hypothetical protein|eukprot:CAMPEP_0174312696 /NCGR_PEP_ID=MMETSP0810-20121108/4451_1 /TAXON_ID=73025 ORGANISM="Eutreptiella gymnastica-like, Strain CCMP1594" /NCGR_SAMPLE_ID=MMETSP0810 /ASSEMBLY_ACC=CAM_ASM_000659 /LENGTH=74 /DNA_ID=CAMNT_0015421153 /DNA_START=1261 /DNA_END=1485 /DNA_ORIENTATION=+
MGAFRGSTCHIFARTPTRVISEQSQNKNRSGLWGKDAALYMSVQAYNTHQKSKEQGKNDLVGHKVLGIGRIANR